MADNIIRTREDEDKFFWNQPYFAFLDILGFRGLVRNNSHAELVDLYKRLVNFPVEFYTKYHKESQDAKKERLKEYFNPTDLKLVNISDSIMLWTKNSRESSLIELVSAVKMLMQISISVGIPLRGAIVRGDIEVLENNGSLSIIGRGLVHAYESEGRQNWSGCTIDNRIITFLQSFYKVVGQKDPPIAIERLTSLMVETEIPVKNPITMENELKAGFVVNWADNSELSDEQIRKAFAKYNKRKNEPESITKSIEFKIENTIAFYKKFGIKK